MSSRYWLSKAAKIAAWTAVMVPIMAISTAPYAQVPGTAREPDAMSGPEQTSPTTRTIEQELQLAGAYLVGKGVAKDPAQSAYWFRKAADQGDPGAQNQLGYMYVWGLGVERDNEKAFRWFARAAGDGSQQAKLNMAVMYLKGMGVTRDTALGRSLLTDLAGKRNGRAEDYLGQIYLEGVDVPADSATAEQWFARAARDKNPEGEYAIGQLYSVGAGHEHDFGKAAKLLRESAHEGYVPAMYTLGILLVSHPEIGEKGSSEAVSWLERAAEAGTWQSSAALGAMARDGRGMPQDEGKAFRWFTIAARQGGTTARENTRASLEACRATLPANEQDDELRTAESWLAEHPHADLFLFNDMHSSFPVGEVYAAKAGGLE